ncbi:PQQ-binding-like beta-propeller repeat protein [Galbibacter sp. PAP.153]|uniref:outer membrane protein assembly factor BamB family protein n=1 Tax=Galbibacter sp. PAP.153 TaxID=3104623 RepID=UPI003008904B
MKNIKLAWTYNATNKKTTDKGQIQCQPIVINEVLYGTSPNLRLFALNAATGAEIWSFTPEISNKTRGKNTNRGVVYWKKDNDERILYTVGSKLYAINANKGIPVPTFGTNGKVDLHEGVGQGIDKDITSLSITATSPGVIYKDIFIIGSSVGEGGNAAPGTIRAFNVESGELLWTFHTIPHPGEKGYDTWPKKAYQEIGGVNNWAGMVVDYRRGAIYFGTGSPSSDFYGGNRSGRNLYANCILSLDAATGKLNWHYQTIFHDLWDRDISCQPNLSTINFQGGQVDVVVQATKDGLLYVLDRDTGKSLFPVEEKPVPIGGLKREEPWPIQKFPIKPKPFSRQVVLEEDITNLSEESYNYVKTIFKEYSTDNKFTPPSEKGTLLFGYSGGAEWGGNAIDKEGILYQNANEEAWILEMVNIDSLKPESVNDLGNTIYAKNCMMCHGISMKGSGLFPSLVDIADRLTKTEIQKVIASGSGRMPAFNHLSNEEVDQVINYIMNIPKDSDPIEEEHSTSQKDPYKAVKKEEAVFGFEPRYIVKTWKKLVDENNYPGIKPPWGTLNAIDLKSGEYVWKVPLGEYEELSKKGIPITGTDNYGGPIVTAGGVVFIAATRDEKIRAFDKDTGEVLWEYKLPAAGFATPITYTVNNKQYLVIAAGGGRGLKYGGYYLAFSL